MKPDRKFMSVTPVIAVLLVTTWQVGRIDESDLPPSSAPSIFQWPQLKSTAAQLATDLKTALASQDFAAAEVCSTDALKKLPRSVAALFHFHRAQARAAQGNNAGAIRDLQSAIALGLRDPVAVSQDPQLSKLNREAAWPEVMRGLRQPKRAAPSAPIRNGIAMVDEDNTQLAGSDHFLVSFQPSEKQKTLPIVRRNDVIGDLLSQWAEEGTAVGLSEVLYDNHDRRHSDMAWREFPQLSRIKYSQAAVKAGLDNGFQAQCQFNMVTFGNSSTALTGSFMWRSQPRLAYTNPLLMELVAQRFSRNHLYLYPEHKDYDAGHNRSPGYGDVYPANTPYMIISQGSSYSDKPFMTAVAATVAALRPEVFAVLREKGGLFHCVQMILRRSLRFVKTDADYLTGSAHPVVFDGKQLDVERMIRMAHEITRADIPPFARLTMVQDDLGVVGRDYFDVADREVLFTTPSAIARSFRSMNRTKTIRVAATGLDLNNRDVTFHWVVLQGDPEKIRIRSTKSDDSEVSIEIDHHARFAVQPGSPLETNRVDIGLFVHNGAYYSAPAFISYYFPDNEVRTYATDGRIRKVVYNSNYADPAFVTARNWVDEYDYNERGQLVGWLRTRKGRLSKQRYTSAGQLVTRQDERGRSLASTPVRYVARSASGKQPPVLTIEQP